MHKVLMSIENLKNFFCSLYKNTMKNTSEIADINEAAMVFLNS